MADISVDRNKRLDMIAGLAAAANLRPAAEQQIFISTIELLAGGIDGELELIRQAKIAHERSAQKPADLAKRLNRQLRKRKPARKAKIRKARKAR